MNVLLGLRPKRDATQGTMQPVCATTCIELEENAHTEHHLLEDLTKAKKEADKHRRTNPMRFGIFEQTCDKSLRDGVIRCSYRHSSIQLVSSVDAERVMNVIRDFVEKCPGVHLTYIRDIHTERPRSVYVVYEVQVEPGFSLPSN